MDKRTFENVTKFSLGTIATKWKLYLRRRRRLDLLNLGNACSHHVAKYMKIKIHRTAILTAFIRVGN
jgi:hypothetical protein